MKKTVILEPWFLRQSDWRRFCEDHAAGEGDWLQIGRAEQVQKALLDAGKLDLRVAIGETESCEWIEQSDWLYRCEFQLPDEIPQGRQYLRFGGVDTFAEFYLNGVWIGKHEDMFLPAHIEVTGRLKKQNELLVFFHSPVRRMQELYEDMPQEWQGVVSAKNLVRKPSVDFGDTGKVKMLNVGLFEDVVLECTDRCELAWVDIDVTLGYYFLDEAEISCVLHLNGDADGVETRLRVFSPDNELVAEQISACGAGEGHRQTALKAVIQNPALWWPKNYGGQPLYRVEAALILDGELLDCVSKKVGIRKIEKTGDMRFRVNNCEIKQWGVLLQASGGISHRFDPVKNHQMMELVDRGNINTIRIWGGGMQLGDAFYEEADERGILIWQEFFIDWSYYPESEHYRSLYRQEAEYEVKRLKHHACVLLYSGGNEPLVGLLEGTNERIRIGYKCFTEDFMEPCRRLDPRRFYLLSSPCGGDYPSDTREGDSHPLQYTYAHAVTEFPLFISEQARSTTGPLRSLRRFMSEEELWPEGYVNTVTPQQYNPAYNIDYPDKPYYQLDPDWDKKYSKGWTVPKISNGRPFTVASWKKIGLPDTWWRRAASFFASEAAPLERFFDATDAESLVYRINAATGWFFKDDLERIRRGKAFYQTGEPRFCQGYIYVKLNDTWPQFYCTLIDFFQEVYIPYYQFRRSLSPILLSFDFGNRKFLWGVNDTRKRIRGELTIQAFSQMRNKVIKEISIPVYLDPGESRIFTALDDFAPLPTESVLYAQLRSDEGELISESDTLLDMERHQTFPDAKLRVYTKDDCLFIETDKYAHCVELTGDDQGDSFGWYFEDNYFNLLPGNTKCVRIYGEHKAGTITAKAHYSPHKTVVEWSGHTFLMPACTAPFPL